KYNGEVISADSRQVYKGLDIATGKITEEEMDGVTHHLIDVADVNKRYTAADFARDGQVAIKEILKKGKVPIIAGGTGFYIQALLNPDVLASIPPNENLRKELEKKTEKELLEQLKEIDEERALKLGEQINKRRLVRAVEIALTSPEMFETTPPTEYEVLWIGIQWSKEDLEERIKERTELRIEQGMIEEAKNLGTSFERMRELGLEYKHLADYLEEKVTKEELIENINIGDRQYAKRQRTWFKRNDAINWFENSELSGVDSLVDEFCGR
ncbi:tRNA (adenosine(37)-N6)-dimethylallyltransferase MiaA, partial [Candidatus Kaiserbacteria bacterium]